MSKKNVVGRDVAVSFFNDMLEFLDIPQHNFMDTEEGEKTRDRLVNAFMTGRLSFTEGVFTQKLLKPIKVGEKSIDSIEIYEPSGSQLRSMSIVKKSNDDVGKAMAVLGDVTGLGIEAINKFGSRDLMVSVEVIGLFL